MADNQRRLMPYEHQLVEALGITKDEYLDFVVQQQIYSDPKEGTILDTRNLPTVSIILTVVGLILQVVAALLAKPPENKGRRQQTRDDVFAPRSGFSSAQELAAYGDPINLIYTNIDENSQGGVRVNTSLIWSAIKSFGSAQYVQLLLVLGAGGIGRINYEKTAFGQTPVRDLIAQNYWLYFRPNRTGAILKRDREYGGDGEKDPGAVGTGSNNFYRPLPSNDTSRGDGFSHAISPSTSNVFGLYGVVPINVNIVIRDEQGNKERANNLIKATGLEKWGSSAESSFNGRISEGENLIITIESTKTREKSNVKEEAGESRRSLVPVFDNAAIFKLGSAKFSVIKASRGSSDEGDVRVELKCIESGIAPSSPYKAVTARQSADTARRDDDNFIQIQKTVEELFSEDDKVKEGGANGAKELLKNGAIYFNETYTYSSKGGSRVASRLKFKRNLTDKEKNILRQYIELSAESGVSGDDRFFTKALVKIETTSYETLSPCHIVDLALRARVFRRISGRQEKYGSKERAGYNINDNGLKQRSAMFIVKYKESEETDFNYIKGIFVVRRAADVDNYVAIRFNFGGFGLDEAKLWKIEIEPIFDTVAEIKKYQLLVNNSTKFFYLENSGDRQSVDIDSSKTFSFVGNSVSSNDMMPPRNRSPRDTNEWDLFSPTADTQLQMSFDSGPEFTLVAVTEQIRASFNAFPDLYRDISLVGFNLYSGRNVQDLRSLSVFVEQGRRSRLLRTSGTVGGIAWGQPGYSYLPANADGYANTAPDIFIDTIIDQNDGIGKYTDGSLFAVNIEQSARSKKFCEKNKLYMDGVIAEPTSWRQFWANNAPFSLLELAKADGSEALIPGVPYDERTGKIADKVSKIPVKITALFNQGNILEDSYKEEFIDYGNSTEDVIVTAIYRDSERKEAFPRNNSVEVRLKGVRDEDGIRETIDMSAFVTRRDQAILVSKFLCQTRRHSRRAIEFKTFPTDSYVAPGSYIYVELAQNQWQKIYSGTIGARGKLNLPVADSVTDASYQFLMYNPNNQTEGVTFKSSIAVASNTAPSLSNYDGYVFVLGTAVKNKRVFRVTEVSMDEEGEVTIRGIEHPVDEDGYSLITNGLANKVVNVFTIDGSPE